MIFPISIIIGLLAIFLQIYSWLLFSKKEHFPALAWYALVLLGLSAYANVTQEFPYCDVVVLNETSGNYTWTCNKFIEETPFLTYLFLGLFMIQLLYAIILTFYKEMEKVTEKTI